MQQPRTPLLGSVQQQQQEADAGASVSTAPESSTAARTSSAAAAIHTPPYSLRNELWYFLSVGVPLGVSTVLEMGVPSVFAMVMAGHTPDSATLQASLGYGRTWYNCLVLMPMFGMINGYFGGVVPGCIGAGRADRIAGYLHRSVLLTAACMLPLLALQLLAAPLLRALAVPSAVAAATGDYCRLMSGAAALQLLEQHLKVAFMSLGYAKAATLNSLVTGLGVEVSCNYLFVYRLRLGAAGAAYAKLALSASRLLVWAACLTRFGLWRLVLLPRRRERLLSRAEGRIFAGLAAPNVVQNFGGWFVFELQVLCLASVRGVTPPQLAAGAVWISFEGAVASVQAGWINATQVRVVALMGRQDQGARASFRLLTCCCAVLVALANVPLLLCPRQLAAAVSNEPAVRSALASVVWILAPHAQTRIFSLLAVLPLMKMGPRRRAAGVAATYFSFYLLAVPIAGTVALTDLATTSPPVKMAFCLGATTIAQAGQMAFGFAYTWRLDWLAEGKAVASRANSDVVAGAPASVDRDANGRDRASGTATTRGGFVA